MRGGPVAVSRITKSENCAAAQRRGASESVPLLGMRDMAVAAATVFMAFEPGRLPNRSRICQLAEVSRADGNGRLGVDVCDKSDGGRARNAGSAYGKRQGQVEYAAAFRLEQAIRPMHWRLPIGRPLCYGIASPVRGFAVP